jgi:tetratricopeptide (TPR) repeat protein
MAHPLTPLRVLFFLGLFLRSRHHHRLFRNPAYYRRRSVAVGNGWNAKGLAKAKLGKWQDALLCWENALVVRTQVLGDGHLDVANTCNNMGIAHGKLARPQTAIGLLQQALRIRQQHYGTMHHPEVAATLHNIGNVLQQSGDLDAAILYFGRARDLQQDLLGAEHAQVARAGRAMGHAYFQGRRYGEAHRAYCHALAIFERLQEGQQQAKKKIQAAVDDYTDEIEATRADVQELNRLIHLASKIGF